MKCVSHFAYSLCSSITRSGDAETRRLILSVLMVLLSASGLAQQSSWVRPMKAGDPLTWGRRDGIVFGLTSPGGIKGPRGSSASEFTR
jgi:hypothetical protein